MSEETALAVRSEPIEDIFLVATNSTQMRSSQSRLADWLSRKLGSCKSEEQELRQAVKHAANNKWATGALRSALSSATRRAKYYEKVLAAVQAGYTMIPATGWVDYFAVRVKRQQATQQSAQQLYHSPSIPDQKTDNPALGEGRYVADESQGHYFERTEKDNQGKEITRYYAMSDDFNEVEFPLAAAKPALMNATAEAMALKAFDEIGIIPARRGKDPLIVGRINGPGYKTATFVIAWYIDTAGL